MRILIRLALAFVLICLFGSGQAVQVVRYAQQAAGSATGELFVDELSAGPLKVRTPSHPGLHVGIKRMGDRSLIRLVAAGPPIGDAELKVVLKQGDSEFPFRIPLAVEKKKTPPGSGSVPVLRKPQEPGDRVQAVPAAERQAKPMTASAAPALPDRVKPRATVCPTLIVTPGSLYAATARLLSECGYALGEWTLGDEEILLDFELDELKALDNPDGVDGLLKLLRGYGLLGVIRPGSRLIDIYEHKES